MTLFDASKTIEILFPLAPGLHEGHASLVDVVYVIIVVAVPCSSSNPRVAFQEETVITNVEGV